MKNKDKVIEILNQNSNNIISGSQLGRELNISRNAIWKIMDTLIEEGYNIEKIPSKGYMLLSESKNISYGGLSKYLTGKHNQLLEKVLILDTVDSTNKFCKDLINKENFSKTIIISKEQEQGRGRRGRFFYSPKDSGIYISFIMDISGNGELSSWGTMKSAVVLRDILATEFPGNFKIKWVNDIYLDDKKVSGILCEGVLNLELGTMEKMVIGIGINISKDQNIPKEIKDIYGYCNLSNQEVNLNKILGNLITSLYEEFQFNETMEFMDKYRKYSNVIGENVTIIKKDGTETGKVISIDNNGHLHLEKADGSIEVLMGGDISLRR